MGRGLCQSGLEDTQEAVNGFGWSSQIPHLGVPSAGAGYFDYAVAALSYCQSEDPPSAEMRKPGAELKIERGDLSENPRLGPGSRVAAS